MLVCVVLMRRCFFVRRVCVDVRRYYAYIDAAQGRFCTHSEANGTDVFCSPATANASSATFYARLDDHGVFCLRRGTPAADLGAVWCPPTTATSGYASRSVSGSGSHDTLQSCTLASWQATGHDVHSIVGKDPLFVDPSARDFRLQPGSPARTLGIHSIDTSTVGPQ